jgi:hypothetical protein
MRSDSEAPPVSEAEAEVQKPSDARSIVKRRLRKSSIGRWLLFCIGIVAVVFLVREAGWDRVRTAVSRTAPFLPIILLLEVAWVSLDTVALRGMYGEARNEVRARTWLQSALLAYSIMILLPAGRAGGEVARASILSRSSGGRAIAHSTRLQASVLLANTAISIPCWLTVASSSGWLHPLALLLLGNAAATAAAGTAILLVAKHSRIGEKLARWFKSLRVIGHEADQVLGPQPTIPASAIGWITLGRVIQTIQYGTILFAVGGAFGVEASLVTQGIHLVGAGLGDFVPNAVGITEGAYRLFAGALGLGDDPARAISIALVARLCQFSLAGTALVISQIMARR